jgi:aminopeptidase
MEHAFFQKGADEQLSFIPPGDEEFYSNLHGSISILAPESLTHLQDIEPERIGTTVLARKRLRDILDERENQGKFGWTLGLLTTPELAVNAGISQEEYTRQIVKACYLDYDDPVAKWRDIFTEAKAIKDFLNGLDIERIHVRSESCDLSLTPGRDRQWVGLSGHNIPSFELFTSPDWRGTEGVYFMNQPSFRSGNLVTNLRLEFRDGQVSQVQAESGEDFVKKQIAMDANANKLGEFSLTDTKFSRIDRFMAHTLFDENFGGSYGNCHIALGASYAETYVHGGENLTAQKKEELGFNDSALHWDLVNTEPKTVEVTLRNGERRTIYQDGSFLVS